ncbi:hypothetical protein V8F33_013148 [Rhypophila sp. PSN 637]
MPLSAGGFWPAGRPGCSAKQTRQPALAGGVFHPSPARRPSKIFSGHDALPAARDSFPRIQKDPFVENLRLFPKHQSIHCQLATNISLYQQVGTATDSDTTISRSSIDALFLSLELTPRFSDIYLSNPVFDTLSNKPVFRTLTPRGTPTLLLDPTSSMDQPTNPPSAEAAAAETSTSAGLQGQQVMIFLTPEQLASVRDQIRVRKASAAGLGQDWKEYAGTGGVKLILTADQVIELGRGMGLDDEMEAEGDEDEETDEEDYEDYYDGSSEETSGRGKRKRGEEEEGDGAGSSKPVKSAKTGGEGEGGEDEAGVGGARTESCNEDCFRNPSVATAGAASPGQREEMISPPQRQAAEYRSRPQTPRGRDFTTEQIGHWHRTIDLNDKDAAIDFVKNWHGRPEYGVKKQQQADTTEADIEIVMMDSANGHPLVSGQTLKIYMPAEDCFKMKMVQHGRTCVQLARDAPKTLDHVLDGRPHMSVFCFQNAHGSAYR